MTLSDLQGHSLITSLYKCEFLYDCAEVRSWHEFNWSVVLGTPANFNGFRVLAALLQRRRSTEANQTLHDFWLSPGLVHYIFIFGGSCPVTEFCQVQNSLFVQLLLSPILTALLHGTRVGALAKLCGVEHRAPPIFDSGHRVGHWPLF